MTRTIGQAKIDSRQRVKNARAGSGKVTPLDERVKKYDAKHGTSHWQFISKFLVKDAYGRYLIAWKAFRDDIHASNSSKEAKEYADLLYSAAIADDHPMDEYGEWHHLWPLGVFGSVEDDRNYRRVEEIVHIKLHAALVFFFPWLIELQLSLAVMLGGQHDGQKKTKVSSEVLKECLAGTVRKPFMLFMFCYCSVVLDISHRRLRHGRIRRNIARKRSEGSFMSSSHNLEIRNQVN